MAAGTAAATTKAEAAQGVNLTEPETPAIDPKQVRVNECGQMWRSLLVRAPEGMIADDLRDSKIWRRVQVIPQAALVKLDRLLILAFDESWACEAIVKHADAKSASLVIQKVFSFAGVGEGLFSDGTLEVYWDGASYSVRRVNDKVPMAIGFSSEGLAIDALRKQYPRKVG
jgi:hypothetical protein